MENKKQISWQAPEFKYQPKDVSWYRMSILISGLMVLIALWQKNFLFAFFIVIAEAMIVFWAKELPKSVDFKINEKGVSIGTKQYFKYEEITGFHVIEGGDEPGELILQTKRKLNPYVKILVADSDIETIKEILKSHIPEIEYEESLSDSISRMIGF